MADNQSASSFHPSRRLLDKCSYAFPCMPLDYIDNTTDSDRFDKRLDFEIKIISYKGNDKWVADAVMAAYKRLRSDKIPKPSKDCDFCRYFSSVSKVIKEQ